MTYTDKNGARWSIDKGDWIGSFEMKNRINKQVIKRFSIPFLLIVLLGLILLT